MKGEPAWDAVPSHLTHRRGWRSPDGTGTSIHRASGPPRRAGQGGWRPVRALGRCLVANTSLNPGYVRFPGVPSRFGRSSGRFLLGPPWNPGDSAQGRPCAAGCSGQGYLGVGFIHTEGVRCRGNSGRVGLEVGPAHGITVLVTLVLVAVLFGDRLGLSARRWRRSAAERATPSPAPRNRSRRAPASARPAGRHGFRARGHHAAAAGGRAQGPRSRRAEQYPGLCRGEQERGQHHHRGDRVGLLRRRDVHRHRLGIRDRQARPCPHQFSRRAGGRFGPGHALRRLTARRQGHRRRRLQRRRRAEIRVPAEKLFPLTLRRFFAA